jgi:PmbA protein
VIGEERIGRLTEELLRYSGADQTEVVVTADDAALTRFANSAIHQNVMESNAEVRVRAVLGKRIGVATSNSLDRTRLEQAVDAAIAAAKRQPENPDFVSLPSSERPPRLNACDDVIVNSEPEDRAEKVRTVCRLALEQQLSAAGALQTTVQEYAVANSLGVFAYDARSTASLNAVMMADTGSGYAEQNSVFLNALEPEAVAREAIDRALRSRNPVDLPPGEYTTLLDEYAVAEMLFYLAYMGLGALAVQEGRSFMNGRFGEQIADPRVRVWDDGWDPRGFPLAFDYEGVPKQKVELIAGGVANAVVYDSYTASREGKQSTGHALPAPNSFGPFPLNLVMGVGDSSREEMLASMDRGILVTRFWYVNVLHPMQSLLTGMTRDGTFLVEKGEVVAPVKNLRFTQSVVEALDSVRMIGREARHVRSHTEGGVVPRLLVEGFRFTGATE